jgi:hypothetical protein
MFARSFAEVMDIFVWLSCLLKNKVKLQLKPHVPGSVFEEQIFLLCVIFPQMPLHLLVFFEQTNNLSL